MTRRLGEREIIVASHNPGKIREIEGLLAPFQIRARSAASLMLPEAEETGRSFSENAKIKAMAAAIETGLPALSDDSGLVVTALGGDPGIYSARWAGPDRDFVMAMEKLRIELDDGDPAAHFICALCLAWPDGHAEIFEGTVHGQLTWPGRGKRGFGYDPVFMPAGFQQTFGEMTPERKHAISHRADAFKKFVKACLRNQNEKK